MNREPSEVVAAVPGGDIQARAARAGFLLFNAEAAECAEHEEKNRSARINRGEVAAAPVPLRGPAGFVWGRARSARVDALTRPSPSLPARLFGLFTTERFVSPALPTMARFCPLAPVVLGLLLVAPVARAQTPADPVVVETKEFTLRQSDYRRAVLALLGDNETGRSAFENGKAFHLREILRDRVLHSHGRKLGYDRLPEVLALPADKQEWDIRRRTAQDLKGSLKITEKQLRARYDEAKPELETVQIRHVVIGFKGTRFNKRDFTRDEARELGEEVRDSLAAGEGDLAEAAREYSHHEASGKKGGLSQFRRGDVDPKLEEAAFSAPIGKLLIVESALGFHLLRVEKRWFEPSFAEMRAELEEMERAVQFEKLLDDTIKSWRPKYAPGYEPLEDW
ncbi:MAG: hypothetical protein C0518_10850 [Opitutus sp.]|nr:hypothetical protein [Opitutus sp.]